METGYERNFLVDSLDQRERTYESGRPIRRQTVAIRTGVFRSGDRMSVMADMEPALQVVLLQPACTETPAVNSHFSEGA